MFGLGVSGPIEDITPTFLTRNVLETVRECDHLANSTLIAHGEFSKILQTKGDDKQTVMIFSPLIFQVL